MDKKTAQIKFWQGDFGKEYSSRNTYTIEQLDDFYNATYGVSRNKLNEEFIGDLSRDIKILEVGCNVGQQLRHLQTLGFNNLYGIEIQKDAVQRAKMSTNNINIIYGSAFDIPFKDNYFDIVFTSGVLSHIHPDDVLQALREIHRCSNKYIWGFECYSKDLKEIEYRGHKGFMWKRDFCQLYSDEINSIRSLKEKKIKYIDNDNEDQMFLLEKG